MAKNTLYKIIGSKELLIETIAGPYRGQEFENRLYTSFMYLQKGVLA